MIKISKQNYSVARVKTRTQESVGKFERHIERKNEHYANMNVDLQRAPMNVSLRDCGELTYNEMLQKLVDEGKVSMRGLKKDAKVYDELIFDINSEYFEEHGGYEFAKAFYEEAYYFAEKLYGKDNILSAVFFKVFRINIKDKLIVNLGILFKTTHRNLTFIHQLLQHFVVGEFAAIPKAYVHRNSL